MKFSNRLLITIALVGSVAIADLLLLEHKKSLVWGSSIPGFWALFGVIHIILGTLTDHKIIRFWNASGSCLWGPFLGYIILFCIFALWGQQFAL